VITLTDNAITKVQEFADDTPEASGKELRIFIQGLSCSGSAHGFTFDEKRDGDTVVEAGDLKVLVDAQSAPYLAGSTVDFVDDERGAGFTVDNPNAAGAGGGCGGGCSCG